MDAAPKQALHLLLEQAERERDAAQSALRVAEDGARSARLQAEQLQQYRQDHHARWGAQPGRAGTVAMLQCVHGFVLRLDQAVAQQQRQVELSSQRATQALLLLQAREMRVAAVHKLIERRLQADRSLAVRREQKQTDEAAQRSAWSARHVTGFH